MHVTDQRVAPLLDGFDATAGIVAEKLSCLIRVSHLIDAHIDHRSPRFDEITANKSSPPDGGNQNVRLASHRRQITSFRMTHRHGCMPLKQKGSNGSSYNLAAAHDTGVRAGDF